MSSLSLVRSKQQEYRITNISIKKWCAHVHHRCNYNANFVHFFCLSGMETKTSDPVSFCSIISTSNSILPGPNKLQFLKNPLLSSQMLGIKLINIRMQASWLSPSEQGLCASTSCFYNVEKDTMRHIWCDKNESKCLLHSILTGKTRDKL